MPDLCKCICTCKSWRLFANWFSFRSVTLVGEKGRKILKEVVKQAKVPPKSRVMSLSVIEKCKTKIASVEDEVATIVEQEKEEKQVSGISLVCCTSHEVYYILIALKQLICGLLHKLVHVLM